MLISSVATELEIGEPSRAELADFQKRAEPSWMFFKRAEYELVFFDKFYQK